MNSEREQGSGIFVATRLGEILERCASAGPGGWFPSDQSGSEETRERFYDATLELQRLGLIEVVDWQRGRGQGFALTEQGRERVSRKTAKKSGFHAPLSGTTTIERRDRNRAVQSEPQRAVIALVLSLSFILWFIVGAIAAYRNGQFSAYINRGDSETLDLIGAASGIRIYAGDWWRLASSCFVHIGLIHLLFNTYAMVIAGSLAENAWGRRGFALIFAISGLAGSTFAMALKPESLLAGASGGIWGVLGSIVAWLLLNRRHLSPEAVRFAGKRLGVNIAINALISLLPGISWQGHLGGGIAGFLTACLLHQWRVGPMRRGLLAWGIFLMAVVVAGIGFRNVILQGTTWETIRQADWERHNRPQREERLKHAVDAANAALVKVPFSRLQQLHADGALAMSGGNRTQLQKISRSARSIAEDAKDVSLRLNQMAEAAEDLHHPRQNRNGFRLTITAVHAYSPIYDRIALFAESVEKATSATPPDLKTWLTLSGQLKSLKDEYAKMTATLPKAP